MFRPPRIFLMQILIPRPLTEKSFQGFGCLVWLRFPLLAGRPGNFPSTSLHRGRPLFLLFSQFGYRLFTARKAIGVICINNLHLLASRQHFFQVFTLATVIPFSHQIFSKIFGALKRTSTPKAFVITTALTGLAVRFANCQRARATAPVTCHDKTNRTSSSVRLARSPVRVTLTFVGPLTRAKALAYSPNFRYKPDR